MQDSGLNDPAVDGRVRPQCHKQMQDRVNGFQRLRKNGASGVSQDIRSVNFATTGRSMLRP